MKVKRRRTKYELYCYASIKKMTSINEDVQFVLREMDHKYDQQTDVTRLMSLAHFQKLVKGIIMLL